MRIDFYKVAKFFLPGSLGIACVLSVFAPTAHAAFSVEDKSWPKQLPRSEYNSRNYYGNSQAEDFKRAINEHGDLSTEEYAKLTANLPKSEFNRWYAKLGLYRNDLKLSSIKNNSTGAISGSALTSKKEKKSKSSILIGLGYNWKSYRGDLEYNLSQNINYNKNPLFTGSAEQLVSKVKVNNLIANLYYDFKEVWLIRPFVGGSFGIGINEVSSTLTGVVGNGSENSKKTINPVFGINFGGKARIMNSNAFAEFSYRYLELGKAKWNDKANLLLSGKLKSSGFYLGINYLL